LLIVHTKHFLCLVSIYAIVNYKFIKVLISSIHLCVLIILFPFAEFGGFFVVWIKLSLFLILVRLPYSFPAGWGLGSIKLTGSPEVLAGILV
jgi:hypothetical protein